MSAANDSLKVIYDQLCTSYRAIDDFRAKLLGFLPLASGAGIFLLINGDALKIPLADDRIRVFQPIGLFGALITSGLFIYELYGIQRCAELIRAGKKLEYKLNVGEGQFVSRPDWVMSEPLAACIIYPAVIAAWLFLAVALVPGGSAPPGQFEPVSIGLTSGLVVVILAVALGAGAFFFRTEVGRRARSRCTDHQNNPIDATQAQTRLIDELTRRGLLWTSITRDSADSTRDDRSEYTVMLTTATDLPVMHFEVDHRTRMVSEVAHEVAVPVARTLDNSH
jgi:hypothetical protein